MTLGVPAMGFFWDLYQQSKIAEHDRRSESLEHRVEWLERELAGTRALLRAVLERLEKHLGEDINRDGRVG